MPPREAGLLQLPLSHWKVERQTPRDPKLNIVPFGGGYSGAIVWVTARKLGDTRAPPFSRDRSAFRRPLSYRWEFNVPGVRVGKRIKRLIDPPRAAVRAFFRPVTIAELPTYCLMPFQYDRNHWNGASVDL